MLLPLLITTTLLGLTLACLAKRGRKIDNHPLCKNCGYDLIGRPKDSNRCSECGKNLNLPNAIRLGNRKPLTTLLHTATALTIIAALTTATLIYSTTTNNYFPYAPTWFCLYKAQHGSEPQKLAAFAELDKRLGTPATQAIINRALAIQADPNKKWNTVWGELVENAHFLGILTPAQWQQYLDQILTVKIEIRPQAALNHGIAIHPTYTYRVGTPASYNLKPPQFTTRSGTVSQSFAGMERGWTIPLNSPIAWPFFAPQSLTTSLGPGRKQIELECIWELQTAGGATGTGTSTNTITQIFDITILPEGEPDVRIIHSPELQDAIEKAISEEEFLLHSDRWRFRAKIVSCPPTNLVYDIIIRTPNGSERKYATQYHRAGQNKDGGYLDFSSMDRLEELAQTQTVELILRPSIESASKTLDIFEILGGEIRKQITIKK